MNHIFYTVSSAQIKHMKIKTKNSYFNLYMFIKSIRFSVCYEWVFVMVQRLIPAVCSEQQHIVLSVFEFLGVSGA